MTNVEKLVVALTSGFDSLEAAVQDLLAAWSVDTAYGALLDRIGAIVGEPRGGLDDATYRLRIRARVATNRSFGRTDDLLTIARLVLPDAAWVIEADPEPPAAGYIRVTGAAVDDATAGVLIDFLRRAVSAGVRLILETSPATVDDMLVFPTWTRLTGGASIGSTALDADTTGFPAHGSLVLDEGTAAEETDTYNATYPLGFLAVSPCAQNHLTGGTVRLDDGLKGLGDSSDATAGGQLADARE